MTVFRDCQGLAIRLTDSIVAHPYGRVDKNLVRRVAIFHEVSNYNERLRATLKRFREWTGRRS